MIAACLLGLILGLVAGSFIATLVIRWPERVSIVHGRSRCDSCEAQLQARDLIPVISHLLLQGRCRFCGAPIAPSHLLIELGAGTIGLLAFAISPGIAGLAGAFFGWTLFALALLDARYFWLPDALTLPLVLAGILVGALGVPPALPDRIIGLILGGGIFALVGLIYRRLRGREGLGKGDAKLMVAIGAWLGWAAVPFVVVGAGVLGFAWVVAAHIRGNPIDGSARLPLGTFLAISACLTWFVGAAD